MQQYFVWVTVATVLLLAIEVLAGRHKGAYHKGDYPILLGCLTLGRGVMGPLVTGLAAIIFSFLLPPFKGQLADTPFWLAFPVILLISDFCFYWVHRWSHQKKRFPLLYKMHRTHHSGQYMNVTLSFRTNPFFYLFLPAGWVTGLALYLGLGEATMAVLLITKIWNLVIHSNFRWDDPIRRHRVFGPAFRAVEHVLVSPGIHHTHHGYGKDGYAGRNFCTVISFWDWVFGTLHIPEGRPEHLGIRNHDVHWAEELFYPLVNFSRTAPK